MSEYERWLLDGDIDEALGLLRRIAAQAARTSTFPPPKGYGGWSDRAIDELLIEMIDKKGGVSFVVEALASVDNQGSAERYLLVAVQNVLKDQARSTAHGKLRTRLETLLGNDARFQAISSPDRGWRLVDGPDSWWQGDLTALHRAALRVRGVYIPSWNTSGPTPRPAREAVTTVALEVLTAAGGIVRAEDLAKVLLERFRHEIAPETAHGGFPDDTDELTAHPEHEPEHALTSISAEQLWARFTSEQRAIVPYLTDPEHAATAIGIGPKEAAARRAQVIELVRLATLDDPRAEAVVISLLDIASLTDRATSELARLSSKELAQTEGMMRP